jgi:hypothetical protein
VIAQATILTTDGPVVVDTFDDEAPVTNVTDVPPSLDEITLAYIARLEASWSKRVEEARIETEAGIVADFEAMGRHRNVLMAPGAAAAHVRLRAFGRRAA